MNSHLQYEQKFLFNRREIKKWRIANQNSLEKILRNKPLKCMTMRQQKNIWMNIFIGAVQTEKIWKKFIMNFLRTFRQGARK